MFKSWFTGILNIDGAASHSESANDIRVYHDGVDYEFEVDANGKLNCIHQTEGNHVPDVVVDAAQAESWKWE